MCAKVGVVGMVVECYRNNLTGHQIDLGLIVSPGPLNIEGIFQKLFYDNANSVEKSTHRQTPKR